MQSICYAQKEYVEVTYMTRFLLIAFSAILFLNCGLFDNIKVLDINWNCFFLSSWLLRLGFRYEGETQKCIM